MIYFEMLDLSCNGLRLLVFSLSVQKNLNRI